MNTWQLQEAKAKLSELIRASEIEPQIISKHDIAVSVVINIETYKELIAEKDNLVTFFRNSPLKGLGEKLELKRDLSKIRDLKL